MQKPNIKTKKNKLKLNTGFAMLFAVLTSSLLVAIGTSIFSISLKELMIATSAQDSQKAYYAADSAQECALYWDLKISSFPSCLDSASPTCNVSTTTSNTIRCNGNPITLPAFNGNSLTYTYTSPANQAFFYSSTTNNIFPEADIIVTKQFIVDKIKTTIISQGHNTGIFGRRVERGISQAYNN